MHLLDTLRLDAAETVAVLISNGEIDSIGVVELVAWLSNEFVERKRRDGGAEEAGRPRHVA